MTSKEIELNLAKITENLIPAEFIYEFLLAFGISKTTVARLKKGDFNMSKTEGEVLYKGKIFYKEGEEGSMLHDIEELANEARILKQNPRFIILTDYKTVVAKDLRTKANREFPIEELSKNYAFFLPLTGAEIYKSTNDNKADRDASYELAKLYDILIEDNRELLQGNSHNLNLFLSRLLFCFFAEDTGIFETEGMFSDAVANHTKENGSDVHIFLTDLFRKLNTREGDFPAYVADFPYVNGGLFRDDIICPKFSKKSRDILLNCGNLNWDEINPDIFGSMIQAVADPEERSDLGMHYTSVPNILKLIKPLFLDELYEEFEKNLNNERNLEKLLARLSKIKFFDPACGSGNFLIITYKEIRSLEIKIIKQLIDLANPQSGYDTDAQGKIDFDNPEKIAVKTRQAKMNFGGIQMKAYYTGIQLNQFYGIEIKDFAHEMALLSLWLSEHQMNKVFEAELLDYGKSEPILPLKESGKILCGNSARMDWDTACPRKEGDEIYVIGNPPYLGSRNQDAAQKADMELVFKKDYKSLDYVSIWFYKGAKYIENHNAQLAFVSTNSVCQGLLVGLTWPRILNENIEIGFAYQSFKWINNAKRNAGVTVIIVGLRNKSAKPKYLFNESIKKEVKSINAYLTDANEFYIKELARPISALKPMMKGNAAIDDGNFLFSSEMEAEKFKSDYPNQAYLVREFIGSVELINNLKRFCLWLKDANEEDLSNVEIQKRVNAIRIWRSNSPKAQTRNFARKPTLFMEDRQPDSDYLMIPVVSSESREYIPIGYLTKDVIANYSSFILPDATAIEFAIIHSKMHMVWVDAVGGKLKTDYRYSAKLCYNTFPFPKIDEKQKEIISQYVFRVLDERAKFPEKTMAWLYNPDTMPSGLKEAHHELDLAIERIYRLRPFDSDAERLEFLFKMYDEMVRKDTLWAKEKGRKK